MRYRYHSCTSLGPPVLQFFNKGDQETTNNVSNVENTPSATDEGQAAVGNAFQNSGNVSDGAFGIRAGKNAKVNVTFASDPGVLNSLLGQQTKTLSDLLGGINSANSGVNNALAGGLSSILDKITGLAESKQTDGESGKDQRIVWIVVAVLAVVAIIFWRRKR